MCLIFISIQNHPKYSLIVAANRDEFHSRKTSPADFWTDHKHILGGRDLEAGGTWMGVNRAGKISMITNYRDISNINPLAPSRGHLTTNFLEKDPDTEEYMKEVEKVGQRYNGFNFLAGAADSLWYFSNYRKGIQKLKPGFYGLSNHLLDTPWPKVVRGKELILPIVREPDVKPAALFEALHNEQRAPDEHLPDTGIGLERERALSSMFIKSPDYGSRCSTVVTIDKQNHVHFSERVYDLTTFQHTTREFEFDAGSNKV